jgi:hypothetical protein
MWPTLNMSTFTHTHIIAGQLLLGNWSHAENSDRVYTVLANPKHICTSAFTHTQIIAGQLYLGDWSHAENSDRLQELGADG